MTSLLRPPLVVTMGEPAGIGGDILLDAWSRRDATTPPFLAIDSPERLRRLAARLGHAVPMAEVGSAAEAVAAFPEALPVLPHPLPVPVEPGRPDPANAGAVVDAIARAVSLVREGEAAALVTNPINKRVLYDGGFRHPGHTEYLAALVGPGVTPVMMLACRQLKVVPVTVHLPLAAVAGRLAETDIVACGRIAAAALRRDFGIDAPRIAVAGLNPHAGEEGALGREEIETIAPAVARLRGEGVDARGPFPADTLFHEAARAESDLVLCMYHDQALIPLKTLDFDGGVNVTLGLPFIRTSPDHGTGFAVAGTGRARSASLVAAMTMAAEMADRRAAALG